MLRKYFRNPALTTDVIVGFPGETEEEFAESKAFVDKVDFYETHIFKYSRREGTKAAAMKDQVPDQIKAVRSAELIELSHRKQAAYEERLIGTHAGSSDRRENYTQRRRITDWSHKGICENWCKKSE